MALTEGEAANALSSKKRRPKYTDEERAVRQYARSRAQGEARCVLAQRYPDEYVVLYRVAFAAALAELTAPSPSTTTKERTL